MNPDILTLQPLTAEAFRPFGNVIQKNDEGVQEINDGQASKYADLALIDTGAQDGKTSLHIYRSQPVNLPFRIERLERHPLGSQAFIPLHTWPFLVVVALPGNEPESTTIRGFVTDGEQGVNYHKGVWHHYQLSLGWTCEYLVIDRGGPGHNCDEYALPNALVIQGLT